MTGNNQSKKQKAFSIRWKLLFYMTVFVVVILIFTWIFQILLLGDFYRSVKREEMKETSNLLAKYAESDDLSSVAYNAAVDHSFFITIYQRNGNHFEQIAGADATGNHVPKPSKTRVHFIREWHLEILKFRRTIFLILSTLTTTKRFPCRICE